MNQPLPENCHDRRPHPDPDRQLLVGTDHVTVLGWERTVSNPAGKAFECEWVHVWRVRDGRISSFWGMLDTAASASAR